MQRRLRDGFPLPEKIGTETHFTWGPVLKLHKIEALEITIVEYEDKGTPAFSIYHQNKACGMSTPTLEQAVIFGIGIRKLGSSAAFNGNAPYFACKLLDLL